MMERLQREERTVAPLGIFNRGAPLVPWRPLFVATVVLVAKRFLATEFDFAKSFHELALGQAVSRRRHSVATKFGFVATVRKP